MNDIFLGLGTNLGERIQNLQKAVDELAAGMTITAVSPVYETPPWGVADQPDFLNICLAGLTEKSPKALLTFIKSTENALGRTPTYRWGPRLIDIDLLFYDQMQIEEDDLVVPHPRLHERAFVLAPLADIAPDLRHPPTGRTIRQLLAQVDTREIRPLPHVQVHLPHVS